MTCIIALCVILSGTVRECAPDSLEAFYLDEPRTRSECREVFYGLQDILPANLRLVRYEWAKPQVQTVEEPRR